ncbi:LysR family transcriptional regulator [Sphingobium estronivorans]|uniref:LysR family transcriptional regulator n=1 Tax=Sphingobium estronivorans TaxID=1577690 RepID=UPI0012390994|nr:LysR family transcriptional regulator [Sphingobium estronivorans]
MRLDFDRVLKFAVVAQELSFTRAADRLCTDQPWLSRQIMQLEGRLGFALFKREASRIYLTPDGEEFLAYAEKLAEISESTTRKAEEMQRRRRLNLRIGVARFTYWFQARNILLEEYKAVRSGVNLDLTATETTEGVLDMLRSWTVDVGLVMGPVGEADMEELCIERGHTTLSIPEEDPLAAAESVALSDLRGRRVAVTPVSNEARRDFIYGWVDRVGAISVMVPEGHAFMADAAERERLFFINLAPGEKNPPRFVRRPIHGPKPRANLYLVKRKGITSPAMDRLWRLGEELATQKEEEYRVADRVLQLAS